MNVLIVDDQREVLKSLEDGVRWKECSVERLFAADSADEARLILNNFPIDLIISDIEMPGEDGLSLCKWAKENISGVECVFLTAHADFGYAQKAIRMDGAGYLLQPVQFSEVEAMLVQMRERFHKRDQLQHVMLQQKRVLGQKNTLLDAMMLTLSQEKWEDAERIWMCFRELLGLEQENGQICLVLVQIVQWKKVAATWEDEKIRMTICHVLDDLLLEDGGKAGIASIEDTEYWVFLSFGREGVTQGRLLKTLDRFARFAAAHMDFFVAIYPFDKDLSRKKPSDFDTQKVLGQGSPQAGAIAGFPLGPVGGSADSHPDLAGEITGSNPAPAGAMADPETRPAENRLREAYQLLRSRMRHNKEKRAGIFLEDAPGEAKEKESAVDQAISYVQKNLKRSITRTEVAEHVHLNEEYFSRLFKRETGMGFKEYVQAQKLKEARKLLANSNFPVEIIASKVGYSNFSYFSSVFKKVLGISPQEYRKAHGSNSH